MASILDFILRLFGIRNPASTPPPIDPSTINNSTEPAQVTLSRVLVLVYDPIMDPATGKKLSEVQNWHRVEDLANQVWTRLRFLQQVLE